MNPQQVGSSQKLRWKWQDLPWILSAYLAFAIFTIVLLSSIDFAPDFHAMIVPYIGWSGIGVYSFTIYFVIMAMFTLTRESASWLPRMLVFGAVIQMIDVCVEIWGMWAGHEDFGNPYLMYNQWRPLITVAPPLICAALLNSVSMRHWVKSGDQSVGGE